MACRHMLWLQMRLHSQCDTCVAVPCAGCFGGNVRSIPGGQMWTGLRALQCNPNRLCNRTQHLAISTVPRLP